MYYIDWILQRRKFFQQNEKQDIIEAEEHLGNCKVVVTWNPENKMLNVSFFRNNVLLEDVTDFTWDESTFQEFQNTLNSFQFKVVRRNTINEWCYSLKKFLRYIKPATLKYVQITGSIDLSEV